MKVISYFSYKGGSGRTSLLYNTLPYIAQDLGATPEEPIIVMDLDIDSKGLSFLFRDNHNPNNLNAIDVLNGDIDIYQDKISFFKKLQPIGEEVGLDSTQNDAILFITADTDKYLDDQNETNFDSSNASLRSILKLCKDKNCKALILDNPAGGQLSGDFALSASNKIVTCLRITSQFRSGTLEFLRNKSNRFKGKEYIIVPNAVPKGNNKLSPTNNIELIKKGIQQIDDENIYNLSMIENEENGINEVERFKFFETNLAKLAKDGETLASDETEAVRKYKKLSKEICR